MILQSWAGQLLHASCPAYVLDLHVKDTVAALFAGVATVEGRALCRLYGGRDDGVELAAAAVAIARLSECDDIHLPSCVTPGAVTIPVALALGTGSSEAEFNRAVSAGYAAGLQLGISIGGARALAGGVWATLVAAPLMAEVTASCLAGYDSDRLAHAMALALAGTAGRIGRPAGSPSGRWYLLAEAVAKGMRASTAAGQGFRGDLALLSQSWLAAQAGHDAVDMGAIAAPAPPLSEVGFKPFPIARQGANAVAAFQSLLAHGVDPHRIESVEVFVPAMNVALLGRPVLDDDRLSRLSNMGLQLAYAALAPGMLYDLERTGGAEGRFLNFARNVSVKAAPDLDAHLPSCWPARVAVRTDGRVLEETVIGNDFDPGASGLDQRLNDKWRRLAPAGADFFAGGMTADTPRDRALIWQTALRHVSIAAQRRSGPVPVQG